MRVVLDSNVLLVAIGKRSRYRPIWNAFVEGKFEIGLCQEILHERLYKIKPLIIC